MNSNMSVNSAPVNFFMGGGRYISDKLDVQIIDTDNPNAFEDFAFETQKPDLMNSYIESEPQKEETSGKGVGFLDKITSFFSPPKAEEPDIA